MVGSVNPAAIMAEVASVLGSLPGIRTAFPHPVDKLGGFPSVVVGYPERIAYGELASNADRITLPVAIVVGGVIKRETADKVGKYLGDEGAESAKRALNDKSDWLTCDVVTTVSAETDVVTIADVDYLAAMLELDIAVT